MVFVSLGASFSAAGQFLLDYREWIRIAGGVLIIVFGLYIAGVLRIGIFGRTQQLQIQSKPAGLLGSFLVGLTFAIGWTPCVGPILGSILTLASNDRTVGQGVTLLLFYSAGLGLPFLLSSVALGSFLRFFKRYRPFIPTVERAAGVLLVARGGPGRDELLHAAELVGDQPDAGVAAQAALTASPPIQRAISSWTRSKTSACVMGPRFGTLSE